MGEEKKQLEQKNHEEFKKEEKTNENPPKIEENKPKSEEEEKVDGEKTKEIDNEVREIVMKVYMHCEGCARKVRKCLKDFEGVQEVITECKLQKVVVKGEKLDPIKVVERVEKKSHRQVELISPIPTPHTPQQQNKAEVKEATQIDEVKEEPKVIIVVLKVHMHCAACSLEIKKRIERMKEVEEAIPDLRNSQVSVKGTFEPLKLVDYVYKRTGKHAIIVKQDPPQETKEDDKGGKDEKKGEEEGKKGEEKGEESKVEKQEEGGVEGGGSDGGATSDGGSIMASQQEETMVDLRRNEYNYNYYPPKYALEMNTYPPQMFSDENPNACSIM